MRVLAASIFCSLFWVQTPLFASGEICPAAEAPRCNEKTIGQQESCLAELKRKLFNCRIAFGQLNANTVEPNKEEIFQKLKAKMDAAVGGVTQTDANITADALIVSKALSDLDSYLSLVQSNYQNLMKSFVGIYRDSEESVESDIANLGKTQESSDRPTLIQAIVKLRSIRSSEADLALSYRSQASLLQNNVNTLSALLQDRLQGKTAYIEAHGLADLLNPLVNLKLPLQNVLAYVLLREEYFNGKINQILDQLDTRLRTVQKLEIDAEIGPTLKQAAYLSSVNNFMGEVEAARQLAFLEGPKHSQLNIPYFAAQYANLRKFLDYGKICLNTTKPKWTESGCLRFNQYQVQANKIYKGTIASYLRQNLNAIESRYPGIMAQRVQYVRTLVEQKSYAEAVALHDALLGSELFR